MITAVPPPRSRIATPESRVATVPDLLRVARDLGVSAGTLLRAIDESRG